MWDDGSGSCGYNAINDSNDPMDTDGHGTHVAGIIGAAGDNGTGVCGVNWKVRIMALKLIDLPLTGKASDAVKCIDYVIARHNEGVRIAATSNSWGGSIFYSNAIYDAIAVLNEKGILFIAAAGNNSRDNDTSPFYPANYELPNVISVANSNSSDNRSGTSSYGKNSVHLAAPGSSIYSTVLSGRYGEKSGTSMATPFVTGVAGLLAAKTGETDAEQLKKWILQGVARLPQWTDLVSTGGRLNAAESMRIAELAEHIKPAEDFTAERSDTTGHIALSWQVPAGATEVIIRRRIDTFPARWDENEGIEVYRGAGTSFADEDSAEDIPYYYSCWAYYANGAEIEGDEISAAVYSCEGCPPPAEPSGGGNGGGCFIAAAAFGSPYHPHVRALRHFRDRYLLTNPFGRAFVSWYYRHGPKYAAVITRNKTLRVLTRTALIPLYSAAYILNRVFP